MAANKDRDLYQNSKNNLGNLKIFLKKNNFNISKIIANDPYSNELNINFSRNNINNNFLNFKEKFILKFYQKFIRKIIMNHYKIFLYQIFYRVLNAIK